MNCRVVDPGLPSWPALYLERESGRAIVRARVADWRAMEWGRWLVPLLRLPLCLCVGAVVWTWLGVWVHPILRLLCTLLGALIGGNFLVGLLEASLPSFLARWIFAKRLIFVLQHDAVGFRSWFFSNGVRVDRAFDGREIQIAFVLRQDPEALDKSSGIKGPVPTHLQSARVLELVVRGKRGALHDLSDIGTGRLRSIPVASMRVDHAERFTVVLNAALELTRQSAIGTSDDLLADGEGRDLDLFASTEDR